MSVDSRSQVTQKNGDPRCLPLLCQLRNISGMPDATTQLSISQAYCEAIAPFDRRPFSHHVNNFLIAVPWSVIGIGRSPSYSSVAGLTPSAVMMVA